MKKSNLIIDVGIQSDGYVFRINPKSQILLKQINPGNNYSDTVFLSFDTKNDFETYISEVGSNVVQILTRLSPEELQSRYFIDIHFRRAADQKMLKKLSFH